MPAKSLRAQRATAHPEVVHLRFDPRRSMPDDIPADIRSGLFGLYLEHVEGVLAKRGRRWEDGVVS